MDTMARAFKAASDYQRPLDEVKRLTGEGKHT
jgi:hypothetical protein